jgi:hypothetical protein
VQRSSTTGKHEQAVFKEFIKKQEVKREMKKLLIIMTSVVLALALAACGGNKDENKDANQASDQNQQQQQDNGGNAQNEGSNASDDAAEEQQEEPVQEPAEEQVAGTYVDLSARESAFGEEIGTDLPDGSVNYSGGNISKNKVPLPRTISTGEVAKFVITGKFNTSDDAAVRFYLTDANDANYSQDNIYRVDNTGGEFKVTFELPSTGEATHLMIASSAYDAFFQDFTLTSVLLAD